ncbi:head completion/stabilization protein [Pseudomonas tolaasii]|uniref:Head completion/stabilization protein n=2 Tax=Pseudomonas tolaasii TaxID=29442 RepID=A0A7Y8DQX9_PSETO|nr:head completion/stabilization protein [Pseudomonas tolaasii]ARB30853.1 head completion/stabilization protein [Pseudomonas tolaasii]KAB0466341.1 head completion/stabilization protein [Pseudomonas tolaasii]MBY8941516.1 head completion/stabilization protein [Pseudomonas tolaasii]NWC21600.1 head completion/stabilization protein [Pseudomonas tolaasii]NWC43693.1 head completion/stabilization protein [Pseudomonas tolaasii]
MSAFVASGPVTGGHINTDPFWPSIDLDNLRATLRIDASVTPARLETAVIAAAINLNRELSDWRAAQQAAGYTTLDEVPGDRIKDVSVKAHLYRRAIEAGTGAEVCERYRDYSATNTGNNKAEEVAPSIDDYRRDLRWAIRDFLEKSRTTVELI